MKPRRRVYLILILLNATACHSQRPDPASIPIDPVAAPGVRVTRRLETYDVFGTTLADLRRELIVKAVPTRRGRHAAVSYWDLRWRYGSSRVSASGCGPVGVEVFLDLTVKAPRWPDSTRSDVDESVRAEWARFRNALLTHEANHANLAFREAVQLAARLRRLRTQGCPFLNAEAQRVVNQSIAAIRIRNDEYDRTTNHGRTEGAVLGRNQESRPAADTIATQGRTEGAVLGPISSR